MLLQLHSYFSLCIKCDPVSLSEMKTGSVKMGIYV